MQKGHPASPGWLAVTWTLRGRGGGGQRAAWAPRGYPEQSALLIHFSAQRAAGRSLDIALGAQALGAAAGRVQGLEAQHAYGTFLGVLRAGGGEGVSTAVCIARRVSIVRAPRWDAPAPGAALTPPSAGLGGRRGAAVAREAVLACARGLGGREQACEGLTVQSSARGSKGASRPVATSFFILRRAAGSSVRRQTEDLGVHHAGSEGAAGAASRLQEAPILQPRDQDQAGGAR